MKAFKSVRELARQTANLDGKWQGLTQKETALVIRLAQWVIATEKLANGNDKPEKLFLAGVKRNYNKLVKVKK